MQKGLKISGVFPEETSKKAYVSLPQSGKINAMADGVGRIF